MKTETLDNIIDNSTNWFKVSCKRRRKGSSRTARAETITIAYLFVTGSDDDRDDEGTYIAYAPDLAGRSVEEDMLKFSSKDCENKSKIGGFSLFYDGENLDFTPVY